MKNNDKIKNLIDQAKSGNVDDILKNLSPEDAQKVSQILADKDTTAKLLATPQAQQLLKLFKKGE